MNAAQQRKAAQQFADKWKDRGYEKGESHTFWLTLLQDVYGVEKADEYIRFEEQVKLDHTSFIDGYIDTTHVMIEQKSLGKNLDDRIKQSDGTLCTPFQQAKRYSQELPYSKRPRWIVTCNFAEFRIYDMERPDTPPVQLLLKDLPSNVQLLTFLLDPHKETLRREMELSLQAGMLVGKLYDLLQKQYDEPGSKETLRNLNILCVRLVFCFYAEDAGLFGEKDQFVNYISAYTTSAQVRRALVDLFQTLDTPDEERDKYLDPILAAFPYVSGGLFAEHNVVIPFLTDEIIKLIKEDCSAQFNWSGISPTIFGAVFESTLNPDTRRKGGMHYTSVENIHKVIDPLFLDGLRKELTTIEDMKQAKPREQKLREYQDKLASLTFFDPACGSGNFLTETYIQLRRLENRVLKHLEKDRLMGFGDEHSPIKVSAKQFHGIEINDFAVTVARTALWIAEAQMQHETEAIFSSNLEYFPLKNYDNIIEADALTTDWESVVSKDKLNYIMGNPPFVGARLMEADQKANLLNVFGKGWKNAGNLDFVCAWYKKAVDIMQGTAIRSALVSTNSVCQGENVANLWKGLFAEGAHIDFAYRTFRWDSESNEKAHVHCVIVGFSVAPNQNTKLLFDGEDIKTCNNINAYLIEAPSEFIENRGKPICNVPEVNYGSFALDDGNYTIDEEEYQELLKKDNSILHFLRPFVGAQELIRGQKRWCVWLKGISPSAIASNKIIFEKIKRVQEWRSKSARKSTRLLADTPTLFAEIRQPESNYLAIPTVSSERRNYLPMGILSPETIASNQIYVVPDATIYHFGILESSVHMAWMRAVCGRLEMRYRYSAKVVYNNFPWPTPSEEQITKIEQTAQAILDARALYSDSSLADLYNEVTMPPELRKAHQANDLAVLKAYGFAKEMTESDIVSQLLKMYQELTRKN